jgi:hypothetical protein
VWEYIGNFGDLDPLKDEGYFFLKEDDTLRVIVIQNQYACNMSRNKEKVSVEWVDVSCDVIESRWKLLSAAYQSPINTESLPPAQAQAYKLMDLISRFDLSDIGQLSKGWFTKFPEAVASLKELGIPEKHLQIENVSSRKI